MDQNTETYDNMGTWYDLYGKLRVVEAIIDAATVQASVKDTQQECHTPISAATTTGWWCNKTS